MQPSNIYHADAFSPDKWRETHSGIAVPAHYTRKPSFTGVDLFCGAGGMSLGFMQAGCTIVAASDNDVNATMTYLYNLGTYPVNLVCLTPEDEERLSKALEKGKEWHGKNNKIETAFVSGGNMPRVLKDQSVACANFFFGDIRNLTGDMILKATGMKRGEIGCVMGGPPCQGFSVAGKRNIMDARNSLVFEFARLVVELQPKTMIMENVPAIQSMITPDGLPVLDVLARILNDGGWGTMDMIKRSLEATSGAGAALRKDAQQHETEPHPDDDVKDEAEQMSLL